MVSGSFTTRMGEGMRGSGWMGVWRVRGSCFINLRRLLMMVNGRTINFVGGEYYTTSNLKSCLLVSTIKISMMLNSFGQNMRVIDE